ncbi:alpha/beta hydrolase [Celeribacter sp. PS-C1]|uniref:alpha/beta hydrolase n=1 Tax=Celeribacter sp. PS-C1 TaxID=2820813 RepID=UPI001C667B8D|nr:alpha/beta fold hydrolase [Celeribacter sp. PS-C1]MBW6419695.1 alpha/beta hydrolase [Celeribacter sp. PS-C1]
MRMYLAAVCVVLAPLGARAAASEACPVLLPPEEILGETILCDVLQVSENWGEPEGRTIGMSYVVLKGKSLASFADPVIYFQGGPGGSALNALGLIGGGTDLLRANRDVIVFEARGTAHSNDLYCPMSLQVTDPDHHEENLTAADNRINDLKVSAYSDPDAVYEAIANYWLSIDRGRCVPYLEEQGIDLTQYNTPNTARDVIALMETLGYPSYNLFGGSYGTTVVLEILKQYGAQPSEDWPLVRSVVLDSVAPLNREHYEQAFIQPYVVLRVFDDCEADEACAAHYPGIRQRTIDLLEALRMAPLTREDGTDITLDDLAEILRSSVTNQPKLVPYLPRLVAELEQGETATFDFSRAVSRYEIALADPVDEPVDLDAQSFAAISQQMEEISAKFDEIKEGLTLDMLSNGLIRQSILEADTQAGLFRAIYDHYVDVGGGSVGNIVMAKLEPFDIHPEQRNREGLKSFVQSTVSFPTLKSELLGLVERFSEDEIQEIFSGLTSAAFERGLGAVDSITHRVVSCNDGSHKMFNDVAFDAYAEFEAPQLIGTAAYWTANYQVSCEQLGLAADAYTPPPPGVESDVRTLVLNGGLDTMTPAEWGTLAAETLSNATVVTIPMANHTPGLLSPCGNALVSAFILSPDVDVNRACVDAARPDYVAPDASLPEG